MDFQRPDSAGDAAASAKDVGDAGQQTDVSQDSDSDPKTAAAAVAVAVVVALDVAVAAGYAPPAESPGRADTTAVAPQKVRQPSHAAETHPSDPAHQADLDLESETEVDLASEPEHIAAPPA